MPNESIPKQQPTFRRRERRWWRKLVLLAAISCGLLYMLSFWSQSKPGNLGVHNGQLSACPESPNCVSSTAIRDDQKMDPLVIVGDSELAWKHLHDLVAKLPRTNIIKSDNQYLHVEFKSLIFRFVDDVEFLRDDANRYIHFRSASRVGHSDMGVNRRRMEQIQRKFAEFR